MILCIYLVLAVLVLPCCVGFFSSCGKQRLLSSCRAWAFYCGAFSCWGAQAPGCVVFSFLWHMGSVIAAFRPQSTDSVVMVHWLSCCETCGIFLDQESSLCLVHWQADSLPQGQLGSLEVVLITTTKLRKYQGQISSRVEWDVPCATLSSFLPYKTWSARGAQHVEEC